MYGNAIRSETLEYMESALIFLKTLEEPFTVTYSLVAIKTDNSPKSLSFTTSYDIYPEH
jgi:hypothetical protein